jgi:hypothetical protein
MRRTTVVPALLAAALVTVATALPVAARNGDRIREGACSANSDWKLKVGPRDGQLEVELEVDSNRNGQTWQVRLRDNGALFFDRNRTTKPPSGSLSVQRNTADRTGTDEIVGRAVNLTTGEVCRGSVRI